MNDNLLEFHKLHALGNDCVVSWRYPERLILQARNLVPIVAERHCGIGFDQILLLDWLYADTFGCRIFNADGSEAEQCGNGMRCAARAIHQNALVKSAHIQLLTPVQGVDVVVQDYDNIRVDMGALKYEPNPVQVKCDDVVLELMTVSMGNPHAIYHTHSLADIPWSKWGHILMNHEVFPRGANIGFMEIVSRNYIKLVTYERGVGFSLACGSNACAAVIVGIKQHKLDSRVTVEFALGTLSVEWLPESGRIMLTGAAQLIFSGSLELNNLIKL